jgi:hypothetical protein
VSRAAVFQSRTDQDQDQDRVENEVVVVFICKRRGALEVLI